MIAGVTPSTRSEPASRASIVSTTDSSKYSTPVAAPRPVPSWTSAPFADTSSSVSPREETAAERIVWLIVSPVVSATATIAVPSMRPSTISDVRPRRRPTFRTPSFTSTGCRSARNAENDQRDHERAQEDDENRPDRDAEELGHCSPTDTGGSSA